MSRLIAIFLTLLTGLALLVATPHIYKTPNREAQWYLCEAFAFVTAGFVAAILNTRPMDKEPRMWLIVRTIGFALASGALLQLIRGVPGGTVGFLPLMVAGWFTVGLWDAPTARDRAR